MKELALSSPNAKIAVLVHCPPHFSKTYDSSSVMSSEVRARMPKMANIVYALCHFFLTKMKAGFASHYAP
jgi:hypothetical protein